MDDGRELALTKQLIGNNDDITDIAFVGPSTEPSHVAVATNGDTIRLFVLGTMSCVTDLSGHRDIVLCLGAFHHAGKAGRERDFIVSGAKDNEVRAGARLLRCRVPG